MPRQPERCCLDVLKCLCLVSCLVPVKKGARRCGLSALTQPHLKLPTPEPGSCEHQFLLLPWLV